MHDAILFVAIINKFIHVSFLGYRFVENTISWLNLFSIISHRLEQIVKHTVYQKLIISSYITTQIFIKYSVCIND